MIRSIWYYLKNPISRKKRILDLMSKDMSDEEYIKKLYKIKVGKHLNLDNPQTYTEKLQWIKLYDRRPEYTNMQDKYLVRNYVSKCIGDEYLVPLLGVWKNAEDIEFETLPNQFVLKCNHDCASVIICRDKQKLNINLARKKLNNCLNRNYYNTTREWAYKDIKPLIIAEKYMFNKNEKTLTDYKFFCCSGKAHMVLVASGEAHTNERRCDYYDLNFHSLPIKRGMMESTKRDLDKPYGFDALIPLAEKIAGDFPFIRVDFYLVDGHPYFGEIAFYPSSGMAPFYPFEWEKRIGSWIKLPLDSKNN